MHSQAVETEFELYALTGSGDTKTYFPIFPSSRMLAPNNGQVEKLSLPNINRLVFNFMMCEHPAVNLR